MMGSPEARMNIEQLEKLLEREDADRVRIKPDGTVVRLSEVEWLREKVAFEQGRVDLLQRMIDDRNRTIAIAIRVLQEPHKVIVIPTAALGVEVSDDR